MAVVINGSGTVTGLSVGGLPDGTVDAGTLADDAVGLAQMASGTDGNLITYDTSGNPAAVAVGTSGQVLTSNGAGAAPTMQAGGKVLQVVSDSLNTVVTSSTSWGDITGLSVSITPSATTSKIMVFLDIGSLSHTATSAKDMGVRIVRDSTPIGVGSSGGTNWGSGTGNHSSEAGMWNQVSVSVLDSPSTTSATTYKAQGWANNGTWSINTRGSTTSTNITHSSITVMEIGA